MKQFLKGFLENGYSEKKISTALCPSHKQLIDKKTDKMNAFLSYILKITDHIGRILKKHDIRTIYDSQGKFAWITQKVKGPRNIYQSCNEVYVGTTKCSINTRL
jgi:hypothetical protein